MAYPQTANIFPISIPVGGVNFQDNLAAMEPVYSPWMINFDCETQYITTRPAYVVHASTTTGADKIYTCLAAWGDRRNASANKLFVYRTDGASTDVYNVSTHPPAAQSTGIGGTPGYGNVYSFKFNGRLAFITSAANNRSVVYDGSSWAAWGFTYSGNYFPCYGGCSYKGRPYVFYGTYLYYPTTVGAVTGAMNRVDAGPYLDESAAIYWVGTISSESNHPSETFIVIGGSAGDVLIYGGDNPSATNWELVGKYKIDSPLKYNSIVSYSNDILVLTGSGVVSIRELMNQGAINAYETGIGAKINNYWASIASGYLSAISYSNVGGCFWPEQNKIYIFLNGHKDASGTSVGDSGTMFVLNIITKAWTLHKLDYLTDGVLIGPPVYYNNNIYFHSRDKIMKTDSTDSADDKPFTSGSYQYDTALYSAHTALGDQWTKKQCVGVEFQLKTTAASSLVVTLVGDFGRKTSGTCTNALLSGYQSAFCSVGMDARYLQYRIGGSSAAGTIGTQIYSAGFAIL